MKYDSATIQATDGTTTETVDLDGMITEAELIGKLWELFPADPIDPEDEDAEEPNTDEMPDHVTLSNPEGFAEHLFEQLGLATHEELVTPKGNFDDLLETWSNETDSDRREAMGEYLDDMGADDLSDFDEAYQGQFVDGAAFAEDMVNQLDTIPTDFPNWIAIDWEQTWNGALRFDYHITDNGHVFRNM